MPQAALPRIDIRIRALLIICSNLPVRSASGHVWTTSVQTECVSRARLLPSARRAR